MRERQPSLKRPLIVQPLILQFVTLAIFCSALAALILHADGGGVVADQALAGVVAKAVVREDDGRLAVRMTPALAKVRQDAPTLWFVARDDNGRQVSFGNVPRAFASLIGALNEISHADFRDRAAPYRLSAVVRRAKGPAGNLTVLGHGKLLTFAPMLAVASNIFVVALFLLLVLISVIATPWIVRRSLAGVARIASEAERIHIDRRGVRLSESQVPQEIGPLVRAVNDALSRLDEGYERQRRFIASAAHELRTPIAILRVKIDGAADLPAQALSNDVARLSNLAEQLLDLERLDNGAHSDRIDLALLIRRVAAELAPILIASNKAIEVIVEDPEPIIGNFGAIERVAINLIQNAVEHGGELITVRVAGPAFEIEDNGEGIPVEERGRVFEPFHRLRPRSSGTGLGLSLVQQVVGRHHGHVAFLEAPDGGTIVRVEFPPIV